MEENNKAILFFDGHCNLCNGFIDFLVSKDKGRKILIASLQGETAKAKLPAERREKLNTLVLLDTSGNLHIKSSAVFRIAWILGGFFHILTPFWIIPRFFTNWVYDFVALNRYRIWGRKDTCRLPTEDERLHFLP